MGQVQPAKSHKNLGIWQSYLSGDGVKGKNETVPGTAAHRTCIGSNHGSACGSHGFGLPVSVLGGWMTNAPSTNAHDQASSTVLERKDWKRPMLDILALANAAHGNSHVNDHAIAHKSG